MTNLSDLFVIKNATFVWFVCYKKKDTFVGFVIDPKMAHFSDLCVIKMTHFSDFCDPQVKFVGFVCDPKLAHLSNV